MPSVADRPDGHVASLLAPLVVDPSSTALLTDFDGTLAPIVDEPAAARPLDGVADVLVRLARSFGTVAVVSGRPASFLGDRLGGTVGGAGGDRVHLIGLYGAESVAPDGSVVVDEAAAPWLAVVADAAGRLRDAVPGGVLVEAKGPAVTVHWRRVPEAEGPSSELVAAEAARSGLVAHPGRRSVELRPPDAVDKGSVVRRLTEGCTAACFLGDDLGDLPAFVELGRLGRAGLSTVGVAVIDSETAPAVAAAADLTVTGPAAALALLRWLADRAEGRR